MGFGGIPPLPLVGSRWTGRARWRAARGRAWSRWPGSGAGSGACCRGAWARRRRLGGWAAVAEVPAAGVRGRQRQRPRQLRQRLEPSALQLQDRRRSRPGRPAAHPPALGIAGGAAPPPTGGTQLQVGPGPAGDLGAAGRTGRGLVSTREPATHLPHLAAVTGRRRVDTQPPRSPVDARGEGAAVPSDPGLVAAHRRPPSCLASPPVGAVTSTAQATHSQTTTSARGWRSVGPTWVSTSTLVGVGLPHNGQGRGRRSGALIAAHPHQRCSLGRAS
jgi:hypothetical protein